MLSLPNTIVTFFYELILMDKSSMPMEVSLSGKYLFTICLTFLKYLLGIDNLDFFFLLREAAVTIDQLNITYFVFFPSLF